MSNGYLLDTSVASILYPGRPEATPELIEWLRQRERRTYLSSVSIFELIQGVEKLVRPGARTRASALELWVEDLAIDFEDRMLPLDVRTARLAGSLSDAAIAMGRHPGVADIMIAATAQAHDLTLLTHNLRHFEPLGIDAIDPLVNRPT